MNAQLGVNALALCAGFGELAPRIICNFSTLELKS
jgi:hypothetical protein